MAGGGAVAIYGISKIVYDVFFGLISLTPREMGIYGLEAGFMAATIFYGGAFLLYRSVQIRPEAVFQVAFNGVRADLRAVQRLGGELGGHLESRGLRAYRVDGGTVDPYRVAWVPPRVQMVFDVHGELQSGIVTVEAEKHSTGLNVTFIGLDVLDGQPGPRIVVQGDPSRMKVKDQLKELLELYQHQKK